MADVLNETAAILNETAQNASTKTPATSEGMLTAYGSLVVMAMVPIFFGSFRSVRFHRDQKVHRQFSLVDSIPFCHHMDRGGIFPGKRKEKCHTVIHVMVDLSPLMHLILFFGITVVLSYTFHC